MRIPRAALKNKNKNRACTYEQQGMICSWQFMNLHFIPNFQELLLKKEVNKTSLEKQEVIINQRAQGQKILSFHIVHW